MSGKRQKNQHQLAFWFAGASEACFDGQEGTGTPVVEREAESPAGKQQLRLLKSSTNSTRRIRNRTYGGVGGADERLSPLSRSRASAPQRPKPRAASQPGTRRSVAALLFGQFFCRLSRQ